MTPNSSHFKLPADEQHGTQLLPLPNIPNMVGNMKNRNRHFRWQHQTAEGRQTDRNVIHWKWKWIECFACYAQSLSPPPRLTHMRVHEQWAMSIPHYTIISHRFLFIIESIHYVLGTRWYEADATTTAVEIATEKPEFQHSKCHSIRHGRYGWQCTFFVFKDCTSFAVFSSSK